MLTITERADDYIQKSGITEIRFGVKTNKGCAGFEYIWEAGEFNGGDYTLNFNHNYKIYIDPKQKKYVEDCIIDLKDVDDGTGYKICFENTKVEVKCGCGESLDFPEDVKDEEVWEPIVKVTHMYTQAEWEDIDVDKLLDSKGLTEYKEKYLDRFVDTKINIAGDTVKKVDPSKYKELTDKYRNWRK